MGSKISDRKTISQINLAMKRMDREDELFDTATNLSRNDIKSIVRNGLSTKLKMIISQSYANERLRKLLVSCLMDYDTEIHKPLRLQVERYNNKLIQNVINTFMICIDSHYSNKNELEKELILGQAGNYYEVENPELGTSVMECPYCGNNIKRSASFCEYCGKQIK